MSCLIFVLLFRSIISISSLIRLYLILFYLILSHQIISCPKYTFIFQLNPYISIGLCYVYWDLGTTSPGNLYCSPEKHPNIVKLDLRSPKEMPGHLRSIGSFGRCIVNVSHCACSDLFHNHGLTQHHRLSGSIWRVLCVCTI